VTETPLISLTRVMGTKTDHVYVAVRDTVFMMPHKVASSSIKAALRLAIGCTRRDDRLDFMAKTETRKFNRRIGFVRHPLTRLESCYADKFILRARAGRSFLPDLIALGFRAEMTFAEFVERACEIPDEMADGDGKHFRSQYFDLADEDGLIPTFIGRFEKMAGDWQRVRDMAWAGIKLPSLNHLRASARDGVEWTEQARSAAIARYATDFKAFGYKP